MHTKLQPQLCAGTITYLFRTRKRFTFILLVLCRFEKTFSLATHPLRTEGMLMHRQGDTETGCLLMHHGCSLSDGEINFVPNAIARSTQKRRVLFQSETSRYKLLVVHYSPRRAGFERSCKEASSPRMGRVSSFCFNKSRCFCIRAVLCVRAHACNSVFCEYARRLSDGLPPMVGP